jgi:osmotically-inducible protein OsmY
MRLKITVGILLGALALARGANAGPKAFGHAYQQVASGAETTARVDGLKLERTGQGQVMAVDEHAVTSAVIPQSDSAVTSRVEGNLATDVDVKASRVHVQTNNGVVALSGNVKHARAAEAAIRLALDTDGVTAVNSSLTWSR